ncbi:MAG: SAM-dependent methyltransferase [Lachnospiraceae bacterium]|nr:SAM-dependent methyltransferase [Lachnospiraceae bacterium]
MEISKRLQAVADLLAPGNCAADIGCDHGYISIYLITKGRFASCIAMDVNPGPLDRARTHIQEKQLSTYIDLRLSDGARALGKGEADAAVIAGMGGRLTIKILTESLDRFREMKQFVLQPQSEIHRVRRFLRENGFVILQENMVKEEGKYYPMMRVAGENGSRDDERDAETVETMKAEDAYGPCLLRRRHPVLKEYLEKEEVLYESLLTQLRVKAAEKRGEGSQNKEPLRLNNAAKGLEERLLLIRRGLRWYDHEM